MRKFTMSRSNDESGVSGTGTILEGTIFESGACAVSWLTSRSSIGIYNSYKDFIHIHVLSHPTNGTIIKFEDGVQESY